MLSSHTFFLTSKSRAGVMLIFQVEAGKAREGWLTSADLNIQFDACHVLLRQFHPVEEYDTYYVAFDNSP